MRPKGHHVCGAIYSLLSARASPAWLQQLHDHGFEYNGRRYKLFSFATIPSGQGRLCLVFTSPLPGVASALFEEAVSCGTVRLGSTEYSVVYANMDSLRCEDSVVSFRTLSPIVLTRSAPGKETTFILPDDRGTWERMAEANLVRKYMAWRKATAQAPSAEPQVRIRLRSWYARVVTDKLSFPCAHVHGDVEADPEVVTFALLAGIGEKTGMGFGCVSPDSWGRDFELWFRTYL
jgi:CRISPR-associated endoribonuclease Cas6